MSRFLYDLLFRSFTTLLFFMASIAVVVLSFIGMIKAHEFSQDITADPSIGYAPDSYIPNSHISQWFLDTPVLWPIPILIAISIIIARIRDKYDYDSPIWVITTWFSLILTAIFLFIGGIETTDSKEDTFSTWAEQRYGIEIEKPPMTRSSFLSSEKIDTKAEVVLDDGQTIGLEEYRDARGYTAYIIVDRTDNSTSEELDIIVSD